ncbi:MaoC family dehydratase [Massilia sp. SYSU DXS3249]
MHHDTDETGLPCLATYCAESAAVPEHLQVGYRFSHIHCFDPAQVSAFAYAAGDSNPLHHDPQAAANTRFGKPIASGTHTTALLMGLVASHLSKTSQVVGVSFTLELLKPVFADEQVTLAWEVEKVEPHSRNGSFLDMSGSVTGADGVMRVRGRGRVLVW